MEKMKTKQQRKIKVGTMFKVERPLACGLIYKMDSSWLIGRVLTVDEPCKNSGDFELVDDNSTLPPFGWTLEWFQNGTFRTI